MIHRLDDIQIDAIELGRIDDAAVESPVADAQTPIDDPAHRIVEGFLSVRDEWDPLIQELRDDLNRGHFRRNEEWDKINLADLPEDRSLVSKTHLAALEALAFLHFTHQQVMEPKSLKVKM